MALVKKTAAQTNAVSIDGKSSVITAREAEAQRKKARTLAKQQQAAERIATATSQLASGIAEASSAAEELKRASDQIASGTEEASSAAQESQSAFTQVGVSLTRQLQNAEACQTLIVRTNGDVASPISNLMLRSLDFGEIPSLNSRYAKSAKNGHFLAKTTCF
jgi:methyl-accepting chemotaxis protein